MAGVMPAAGADRVRSGSGSAELQADRSVDVRPRDPLDWRDGCVIGRAAMARFEAVAVKLSPNGRDLDLVLVHPEAQRSIVVGSFGEEEIVARWRAFAAASGLPAAVDLDGVLEKPYPQIGRLQLGAIRIRRRHALLKGRRPRFLVKRKIARLPLRPIVYREREIVGR